MGGSSFINDLLRHPRRLWMRKAAFQVHLWVGLIAALYLIVISLSGSFLVFKDELVRLQLPHSMHAYSATHSASPEQVLAALHTFAPAAQVNNLQFPSPVLPAFLVEGINAQHAPARWFADPQTGQIAEAPRCWIDFVHDLHYYLLLPHSWGMQVNGVGALALLLLTFSGLFLWWPGIRVWTRGLRINLRASWRRINYDAHSAIGFWTLTILFWWAFSGVYFAWYRQVTAAISVVSPVRGMSAPTVVLSPMPSRAPVATLSTILATAEGSSPEGRLWSVSNPDLRSQECYVLLDRGRPGDFSHRDIVRITRTGRLLSIWHYGERHTFADWLLWSMHPLHFGTVWGMTFKVLWASLGFGLVVLTATGVLLYWNRYLRHLWK